MSLLESFKHKLETVNPLRITGRVTQIIGLVIQCEGLRVPIGSQCLIHSVYQKKPIEAEVVGFRDSNTLLMPFGETAGISRGDEVECHSRIREVTVGDALLGRVIDGTGKPIDGKGAILADKHYELLGQPPHPLQRARIRFPLQTGIRSIDALLTIGRGQRMGLFAGSGVGKSVLMGMIARNTNANVNVIGLIGERGREVREFIEKELGPEGLARSVVVVSASNEPALLRIRAALTACAIAEYFRDQGSDVLLMMDSVTRVAYAQREIGLSVGEPAATKGYPPSVFPLLPRFLERAGCGETGSITGIYTVLVDGDDVNDPIADAVRGVLDGHIWLNRKLASRNHYPAVDPLMSVSRVMVDVVEARHKSAAGKFLELLSTHKDAEDLINIGAYVKGSNALIDRAVSKIDEMNKFLRQDIGEKCELGQTIEKLMALMDMAAKEKAPEAKPKTAVPPKGDRRTLV